jgi:two-component system, NtrC family, sensor kinase
LSQFFKGKQADDNPEYFYSLEGHAAIVQNIGCAYSSSWRLHWVTPGCSKNMGAKSMCNNKLSQFQQRASIKPMAYKLHKSRMHARRDESVLMNAFPVPFRFVAVALLSGVLIAIGILNLRDRAILTDATDGVFWKETKGKLIADEVEPGGPGSLVGIVSGDRLVSVNGHPVTNLGQYSDLTYPIKPGMPVTYELETNRGARTAILRFGAKVLLTARDGLRTLLAFLYLGIGIFVLLRGDRRPHTFHFYLLCLAAFVVFLFSYTSNLSTLDWWVYGISILAFLLLPALFVHFCMRFPVDIAGMSYPSLLYLPALLLGMLRLLWYAGRLASLGLPRTAYSSGIIDSIELIYFCLGFLIGGSLLLRRRLEVHDFIVRQQMKWISYGTLAGIVPFSLIYVVPVVAGVHANFTMESSMLFLGLIPLSMGYALIHFRLMDVETIARRSAAYFISSLLLLTAYLLFVLVLGRILQSAVPQAGFMSVCLAVLAIALLFAPLRNAVQARLDRLFYKDQFEDRATLLDFAHTLSSEISLAPLSRSIIERISKTFQVNAAAVFLSDPVHAGFFRMTYAMDPDLPSRLYRAEELIDGERSAILPELSREKNYLYRAGPALMRYGLYYLQDLKHQGRDVGMIALGQLPKGSHFSTEDLDLLSALAGYAAMALENANLYRSIEVKARELERLKTYTENILESVNMAVLALDFEGQITSCNRAFEELYKTTRAQIVSSPIGDLFPADVLASIQRVTGTTNWHLQSPANIFKLYLENRLGKRLIVNISLIPLQDATAVGSGSLFVMDDITEKIELEGQLMQAEKLSSIGLLAAGIAHEVNTPIAGISSYTQMLLKETPESDRRKQILEKIEKQTFRAAEIVNGLLNFSRLNSGEFKDLDINQLIDDSLSLLNHQLKSSHIQVDSKYNQSLPPVYGNAGKLQQVFVNLFMNARDAMPSGGELAVQTAMNDSMVIVDISDTGSGISEENIRRIFDPFFTTKVIGKGTGLGLAITYGIIQEHGGRIFVDSDYGKGTHFRVKLPTRLH